ncbi:hypothetical protein AB1287_00130 [Enterobacter asburiae]|uniref:capsular polysaccharide export protein, LipB/KpsS family n=1 Tax=Scandinavium sp. UTDF21-P1B TaxID=3446379 RepID=UPI003486F190
MIAFLVEGIYYANFFSRIVNALSEKEKKEIVFYSRDLDTSRFLKARQPQCRNVVLPVMTGVPNRTTFSASKPMLADRLDRAITSCFEYVIGGNSYDACWQVMVSYFLFFSRELAAGGDDKMIMCSGCGIGAKAASLICDISQIPTQFVELSNLPNKIFVDPAGTNAHSRLAHDPSILDAYPAVDDEVHQAWMTVYQAEKALPPPQAKGNILGAKIEELSQDQVLKEELPYLFLPLQVSNDAQLWLHSDYRNADAIQYAVEMAAQCNLLAVVKIHPAEVSVDELNKILQLKKIYGFRITMEPTTALLQRAQAVVTINSTVGLEAMLYGKPLSVLGRSYYKQFDAERLKKYIHSYLFSGVEFFGDGQIDRKTALAFLLHN